MNEKAFIYKITNNYDNKAYIGITRDRNVFERWQEHIKSNNEIGKAIELYGVSNFSFEILEDITNISNIDLFKKESEYIDKFNTINNGYNKVYSSAQKVSVKSDTLPLNAREGLEALRDTVYMGSINNNINNKVSFWDSLKERRLSITTLFTKSNYFTRKNSKYYEPLMLIFTGRKQRFFKIEHLSTEYATDNIFEIVDLLNSIHSENKSLPYKLDSYQTYDDRYQLNIVDEDYGEHSLSVCSSLLYDDELIYMEVVDSIREIYKDMNTKEVD